MKSFKRAMVLTAALAAASPAISRADSAKFPLKGLIKSGHASVNTTPVAVIDYSVDPKTDTASGNVFVLTQVCGSAGSDTAIYAKAGTSLEILLPVSATDSGDGLTSCRTFTPGYVIPANTNVTCNTGGNGAECNFSGIVVKKQ